MSKKKQVEEPKAPLALVEPATQQEQPEVITPKPERQQVMLALAEQARNAQTALRVAAAELNSMMFMAMAEEGLRPGEWLFHTDTCTFSRAPKAEAEPK